jgi:hypothetical protein
MTAEERAVIEQAVRVVEWWERDGAGGYDPIPRRLRDAVLRLNRKREQEVR